jgi:L-threonylcarbamoyladenylate synthase
VAAIYALKGRPPDHPLIVHVVDAAQAQHWGVLDARAQRLIAAFWPGPLTLIVPRALEAPPWACGGQDSIGLRCPSHPVAQALLERFTQLGGSGVAAPSANRFGKVSPTTAQHVLDDLGDDAPMVLDGGPCDVGVESTIVDLTRERAALLRPGRVRRAEIEAALGAPLAEPDAHAPRASGTLAAHYSPRAAVELVAQAALRTRLKACAQAGQSVGVWSARSPELPMQRWVQAPAQADDWEAALYAGLRELDRSGVTRILVVAPPDAPGWEAVRDRLSRAAAASQHG